jgi:bacterial/archaeal transporter family-2 protein
VTAPELGAATLIALVGAGQSLASVVVDHFGWVGLQAQAREFGRIAGVALLGTGVVLVRYF